MKVEQLTWFAVGSLANLSPLPGSEEARKMTVTSGLKCLELSRKSGPVGCLVRTLLESSTWHSTLCYLTWKPKVTKLRHLLFQLAPSAPRTEGTGYGLWPTATARDWRSGRASEDTMTKNSRPLNEVVYHESIGRTITGESLNPDWVCTLMGYPPGWLNMDGPLHADATNIHGSRRE